MRQSELIKQLTNQEIKKSLLWTQTFILLLAIGLSIFLFDQLADWLTLFQWELDNVFYYGLVPGCIIFILDCCLLYFLPPSWTDDGGINKRIFTVLTAREIVLYTGFIAVAEELLFRGVLQTIFGFYIATLLFIIMHFRYLQKPVLLLSVIVVSSILGLIYEWTGNLLTVIVAHFLIDLLLGWLIHFKR